MLFVSPHFNTKYDIKYTNSERRNVRAEFMGVIRKKKFIPVLNTDGKA
jgi:hypothetical protein